MACPTEIEKGVTSRKTVRCLGGRYGLSP
jgi:hypothetical protein